MNSGTSLRANNKREKAEFAGCRTAAGLRVGFLIGGSDNSFNCCSACVAYIAHVNPPKVCLVLAFFIS